MSNRSAPFLAVALLSAAFLLTPFARAATDPLMPTGRGGGQPDDGAQPFDPNPAASGSITSQVLTYGVDADGNAVPRKTLRITNNTAATVYPIMRDPNSNVLLSNPAVGLYNPYDPPNQEYRGYIGYEQGGQYYFGLKPGQSILVRVPLVFWNGARIGIGTDGQFLAPVGLPNPLRYRSTARRSITLAEPGGDTMPNGVVMWYRAEIAEAPNDDTEDQLAEWTIRDHGYLANPQITARTNNEIPDTELVNLFNYDVSNVDNLYLPLAMAADGVWVLPPRAGTGPTPNRSGYQPGSLPDVLGWTGAINTIDFLQTRIREFAADNNQLLGQYFAGGKGWPVYNIPNPTNAPDAPIKIPSGANIFAQSPIKAVPSSYGDGTWQNDKYMLSSGGTGPIAATIGWAGGTPDPVGSTTLHVNLAEADKIAFIEPGYHVEGRPGGDPPLPNPIQPGTTVVDVVAATGSVTLSQPLVASSEGSAFTFTRPVSDYASDAMIRLWFSWANHYLEHWRDRTPGAPTGDTSIIGSLEAMTATIHFNEAHPELVEGMAVTGPGLLNLQTEVGDQLGKVVILEIAKDQKSVILSQLANATSVGGTYTFSPPTSNPLHWTPGAGDPGHPIINFDFSADDLPAWHDPYEFSKQVYLIMASINQISLVNNDSASKYMQDIVGANMGFIFTNEAKKTFDGDMVTGMIRDKIKSVLRGVSDFTVYPDVIDDQGDHTSWYPDPKLARGGQPFNVFNLDPFVWFVHVRLGFSGYGFSVDDDTADVGAAGGDGLQLTVTGTGGLKNLNQWSIQAPFGPVRNVSLPYSGPASDTNGDSPYFAMTDVSATTPIRVTSSDASKLANGQKVRIELVTGNTAANGTFQIGNVTRTTFDLFDAATGTVPVASNGAYAGGGRWGYPLRPYIDTGADLAKVFYRVSDDDALGTFLGTFVSVNGVDRNKTNGVRFRVWQKGMSDVGRLILDANLTDAAGNPLPTGTYNFTFFGIAEAGAVPPVPPPPTVSSPTDGSKVKTLIRLRKRLDRAEDIDDPEARTRVIQRIRAWMTIVRRGVDPSSREGRLMRRLVNARSLADPDRRERVVDRITTQLDKLDD